MSQGDTTVAKVTTNFHPRVNSYIKMTAYSILCVRLWGRACLLFCSVILTLVQVLHLLGCLRSEVTFIASQKSYQGKQPANLIPLVCHFLISSAFYFVSGYESNFLTHTLKLRNSISKISCIWFLSKGTQLLSTQCSHLI